MKRAYKVRRRRRREGALGYTITGWVAFTGFWLVGGAFESFLIGWADFLVLSAGLAFGAIASLYGWFLAVEEERQEKRNERRREK